MSNFTYTDERSVRSSAVDEVFYNNETQELAVVLHNNVYAYTDVPADAYDAFVNGFGSKGRHYAKVIKRNYGPGEYLGSALDVNFKKKSYPAPSMGPVEASGRGIVPKGLTLAPDAKVTGAKIDLTGREDSTAGVATRRHRISFLANGTQRTHTTEAESVDAAVAELASVARSFGVTFTVKEVTTYFTD